MTRRSAQSRRRQPAVGEIWAERTAHHRHKYPRVVLIEKIDETHAHVVNRRTGRRSRIALDTFIRGVLTGWYRTYNSRPLAHDLESSDEDCDHK